MVPRSIAKLLILMGLLGAVGLGRAWQQGVLLIPPPPPSPARPGDALTLSFRVRNVSSAQDIFEFSVDLSAGLELVGVPEPVELAPQAEETVFVSFIIGAQARAGAHSVTLTARSRTNLSVTAQASVTITVQEVPGLEMGAPRAQAVEPGSSVTLVFLVRNKGNVPDRVIVTVQPPGLLTVTLPFQEISLDVGERREIPITVKIPKDAPPLRQRLTVRAVSKRFPNVSAEATAVLEILPPLPQDVKGSLFLTIPSDIQTVFEGQTGLTLGAFVAVREWGGVLLPDRPAVRLDVGGALTLENTSSVIITVAVSDGRPPLAIAPGAHSALSFPHPGIFTVTVSGGTLLPSIIIVTVQDFIFRQGLSGRGPADSQGQISYVLDIQNLFELNALFFGVETKPVGFALGDLYLSLSPLATLSGRGGHLTISPSTMQFSVMAVSGSRVALERELLITDDLTELPSTVIVGLNHPIRFRNVGLAPHTVTIPSSGSQTIAPGQSFVYIFTTIGQVTITIDTVSVTIIVIAQAFCGASFLVCFGAEGRGSVLAGVTLGHAALFGYAPGSLTTTLLGHLRWQIPGGSATTLDGGLTWQNGAFLDSAVRASSELRLGDFSIIAQFLRAGRDFVGDRRDEQGLSVFQSFATPHFSLGLGFERTRNNVNNDPSQQTLTRQHARAFLSLKLAEAFPTLRLSTAYSTLVGVGPLPPTDLAQFSLSLQAVQPISTLGNISVFTEQAQLSNAVAGTELGVGTVGSEFAIKLPSWRAALRLEYSSEVDLLTNAVLSRRLLTSAGLELGRRPLSVRLGVARFVNRTDLSVGLQGQLGIAELFFSGLIGLLDAGGADFSFTLTVSARFDAPIPFIVVKGQVEGFVFVDTNSNGVRDPSETGPKNLILTLGNEKARTDAQGFFRFPPMAPGTYELKIEKLPMGIIVQTALPQRVRIVAGQRLTLEIPLAQVAVIEGIVFHDENRNGQLDSSEQGLSAVRVFLTDAGGKTRDQRTDSEGRFAFSELLPGKYTVALDVRSLPTDFSPTTPAEVTVELKAQEQITVNFGAAERPRIVKFPPVAQFEFTPERPKVGETVRFDASESFDPDGKIIKYEWDLESDGTIDAQGVTVEHIFSQAGTFTVTLTVTDNDGETGTARKTITVGP